MAMSRAWIPRAVIVAAFVFSFAFAHAAPPDYKLGDVAQEDVITPVPLLVVNPDATDALKQKVAQEVRFIVRHASQSAAAVEAEMRASITTARQSFMTNLQRSDMDSSNFARVIREVSRDAPKDLPFDKLAPMWVRGVSDEKFIDALVQPVRDVMSQPIVSSKTDNPLPANQSLRLLPVKNVNETPTARELENPGSIVTTGKVLSLWRARRLVETSFPPEQESVGRFAASFVRANAVPDPAATEVARARRMEGVTVNDHYEAAQVIVRKGQTIDRKALSALATMREKSMIGTLQTKLEQEQTLATQIKKQTKWIALSMGAVCAAFVLILWRLRSRPSSAVVLANPTLMGADQGALPAGDSDELWRSRALVAEGKAERAQEAIRSGVLGWMREKIVRTLFHQRAELLSVHQKAEEEMRELEQRLEQLHAPLQERISAYEQRIEELEKDLAAKGEENRELIGARISVARQHLTMERERGRFGTN
jgi:hypothetical protein